MRQCEGEVGTEEGWDDIITTVYKLRRKKGPNQIFLTQPV